LFAGDVTGVNLLKTVDTLDQFSLLPVLKGNRTVVEAMGRGRRNLFLAYLAALAVVLTLTGGWLLYLLLWIIPSLTALSMILRLRAAAEHVGCDRDGGVGGTRTVLANPLERALFSPCRINYHLAHHLYPSVPFYNLPQLHRRLVQNARVVEQAHISNSYLFGSSSVLSRIAQARAARPATEAQP
jgi:fatty acid desaturase